MKIEDIKIDDFIVKEKYPDINIKNASFSTINKINDMYAGNKGEWTAVGQYVYESLILNPSKETKHLAKLIMEISEVEMRHISILSQMLIKMNVDPRFCKYIDGNVNICDPWSTRNVKYIRNIAEFMDYNIVLEEGAIHDYQDIINTTDDEGIKVVIDRIIKDEKAHLALFNLVKKIISNETPDNVIEIKQEAIVEAVNENIENIEEI